MKNIECRGRSYRAHIYRRGARVSKTFGTVERAQAWLDEQKSAAAAGARLAGPLSPRFDYDLVTFGRVEHGDLLSESEIHHRATARTKVCGVYFLIVGARVMYVGQSTDAYHRVNYHAQLRQFESFYIIPCSEAEACLLESRYILSLDPPWNRDKNGKRVLSVMRDALPA